MWKIVRQVLKFSLCKIVEIKIGGALVGYEVIITNSRYALVGYYITSYPTRAHGIIVIDYELMGRDNLLHQLLYVFYEWFWFNFARKLV